MKFGVVVFPGSNCDRDMIEALQTDLQQEVIQLWHKDKDLSMFTSNDCIVLPGGFSYGDYLRCGAIARFSPMMQSVIEFAGKGGKLLGVCNGFQILCERKFSSSSSNCAFCKTLLHWVAPSLLMLNTNILSE